MEVEDEVQLADTVEVLVKYLHEVVHDLEDQELVFFLVDDWDEVEARIPKCWLDSISFGFCGDSYRLGGISLRSGGFMQR